MLASLTRPTSGVGGNVILEVLCNIRGLLASRDSAFQKELYFSIARIVGHLGQYEYFCI